MQLRGHGVQPQLVDLEQTELAGDRAARARGREQRRGDAAGHVRAGGVVHERHAGALEDAGGHRRGRRLAVGRRDEHAAARKARAQRCRSRRRRAPAAPCPAALVAPPPRSRDSAADRPRERELRRQRRCHQRPSALWPARPLGAASARRAERGSANAGRSGAAPARARSPRRRSPDGQRQLADRVAVGVHRERPVGRRSTPRARETRARWAG